MKKLLFLTMTACLIAACSSGGYTINGQVKDGENGDSIEIFSSPDGSSKNIIASTVIKDGKFTLKGMPDSVVDVYYLFYPKHELLMPIFLEKGKISVSLSTENCKATGTPNNDLLSQFQDTLFSYQLSLQKLMAQQQDSTTNEEQRNSIAREASDIQQAALNFVKRDITDNIDMPAAVIMLSGYGYMLDPSMLTELLNKVPEANRSISHFKFMKEQADALAATEVGKPFLDFEMNDINGKSVKLSDIVSKNKVTLIDFWATWCAPCMSEVPSLVKLYNTYKSKGLDIVSVSLDNDEEAWKKSVKDEKMSWTQLSDLQGNESPVVKLYSITGIPFTLLVGQDGKILAKDIRGTELETAIKKALGE